jgi:hypothetical protein
VRHPDRSWMMNKVLTLRRASVAGENCSELHNRRFPAVLLWLMCSLSMAAIPGQGLARLQSEGSNTTRATKAETFSPSGQQAVQKELEKALEEFKIQFDRVSSGPFENTNGKAARRKTRDYRGSLYEYLRNDALDALPHQVRQASGTKSVLRRNQFGFNLSGPVRIPWLYDGRERTFFSITYEGTREKIARPSLATIPTFSQRSGDFSDLVDNAGEPVTIYDPLTTRSNPDSDPEQPVSLANLQYLRDPFPGNRIPDRPLISFGSQLCGRTPIVRAVLLFRSKALGQV